MMEKTKSSRLTRLKLLLVLPALVILFLALACSKQDAGLLPGMEADENSASATENLTYFKPDEMAEYPGGFMALRKYIAIHVKYPEIARKKGVQGKVYVQFVVDEEGKVIPAIAKSAAEIPPPPPKTESGEKQTSSKKTEEEMMVATSAEGIVVVAFRPPEGGSADYDPEAVEALKQEAIRVVQSLPAFEKPARHSGEPVRSIYTFPINFVLQ